MKYFVFFISFLILVACGTPMRLATESQRDSITVYIHDSVYVHDTLVLAPIPAESGSNILPDSDTSCLRTSIAESRAFVKDGQLHHTLRNRSDAVLPTRVKVVDHARSVKTDKINWKQTVEIVEVERELTRWQKFILALGQGTFVAAMAGIIYLLIRILRRLT